MKDTTLKEWIITISTTIAMFVGAMFIYKINEAATSEEVFKCLCNSAFVSGALIFGFGLLVWCANQGAFVGLQYGVKQIFEKRRFEKGFESRKSYAEYRESKMKKQVRFKHMLVVGTFFIALSIIFYFLI